MTVLIHQDEILPGALSNPSSLYHTAHRLHRGRSQPEKMDLQYLFSIKGRCEIARGLSRALADKLMETHPALPLRRLDVALYDRVVRNIEPYILVLAHCLESYRDGLAEYVLPARVREIPWLCVELRILRGYNKDTCDRVCALYYMLKCILDRELQDAYVNGVRRNVFVYHYLWRHNYTDSLDIFIFGGIEAVKDIMVEPNSTRYRVIVRDHLARACPYGTWGSHARYLPRSTLRTYDPAVDAKVCRLLPDYPHGLLSIGFRGDYGFWPLMQWELYRFYEYLRTHEGDQPSLEPDMIGYGAMEYY